MLILTSSDSISVSTSAAVSVIQIHASYVDLNGTTMTPGVKNTEITTTATNTDIVNAPAASTTRAIKFLSVRNAGASNCKITIFHSTTELYQATLAPNATIHYSEERGFLSQNILPFSGNAWGGAVIACVRDGSPNYVLAQMQVGGNVAPTPTNITTTVARCEIFRPAYGITVNQVRWYGIGATTGLYTFAIYDFNTRARVSTQLTLTTTANAWNSQATSFSLTADTMYYVAVSTTAVGTTAGIAAIGGSIAASTGQIGIAPITLPGSLRPNDNNVSSYRFQFAVTAGALPVIAPIAQTAQATWTGGMPAFFLDNNTAV